MCFSSINSDAKNLSHLSHLFLISGTDGTHSYRSVPCPVQWKYSRYPSEYDQNRFGISYNPDTPLFGIFYRTASSPVWLKRISNYRILKTC